MNELKAMDELGFTLKHRRETFVDEPLSIEDVSIKELEFDIRHKVKTLDGLHVFHALKIFESTLEMIMMIQSRPEVFHRYRTEQLKKHYQFDLDDHILHETATNETNDPNDGGNPVLTPPFSPVSNEAATASSDSINRPGRGLMSKNFGEIVPEVSFTSLDAACSDSYSDIPFKNKRSKFNYELNNSEIDQSISSNTTNLEGISDFIQKDNTVEDVNSLPSEEDITPDLETGNSLPLGLGLESDNLLGSNVKSPHISIEDLISQFKELEESDQTSLIMKRLRQQIPEEVISNRQKKIQERNLHILRQFNLAEPPNISIEEYLLRFLKYSNSISVLVYIHSAYLIYRLCIILNVVQLTELNVHRFILALIRCLTKQLEDLYQKQKSFSRVGGVSKEDLFRTEVGFLFLCNFNVVATEDIIETFLTESFIDIRDLTNNIDT